MKGEDAKEISLSEKLEQVNDLIEELTTTGSKHLDVKTLKKLKNLCKTSKDDVRKTSKDDVRKTSKDDVLQEAYNVLIAQMEKNHAEIRFSSFQVIAELFSRSHFFRKLILNNLYLVFLLTG